MNVNRLREAVYSFFSRVFMKEADLPFLEDLPATLRSIGQLFECNGTYREMEIQEGEELPQAVSGQSGTFGTAGSARRPGQGLCRPLSGCR